MKLRIAMLALCLGLTAGVRAFAVEQNDPSGPQCVVKGFINLTLDGDERRGTIQGWLGDNYVNFYVNNGFMNVYINGTFLNLDLRTIGGNNYTISGWIKNTYVNWYGYNKHWNTYQDCIPADSN